MDGNEERRYGCGGRGLFAPLLLIALGVIFLLDQFHVSQAGSVFAYFWPVIIILFGVEMLSGRPSNDRLVCGLLAVGVGVAWVMENLGYWSFDVARLWPLVLICVGLMLLFRSGNRTTIGIFGVGGRRYRRRWGYDGGDTPSAGGSGGPTPGNEATLDGVAVLGGVQRRITAQDFRGGRVVAFFGGFNLDLTRANIAGDAAVLDLSALFGGGEVRVPDTWIIDMQGQALLGGYSDETHQQAPAPGAKRLIVQGTAVFGGVVIKN